MHFHLCNNKNRKARFQKQLPNTDVLLIQNIQGKIDEYLIRKNEENMMLNNKDEKYIHVWSIKMSSEKILRQSYI